jgi:hypothetical protein
MHEGVFECQFSGGDVPFFNNNCNNNGNGNDLIAFFRDQLGLTLTLPIVTAMRSIVCYVMQADGPWRPPFCKDWISK